MASYAFKELGVATLVDNTYTSCGQGTAGRAWQGMVHVVNNSGSARTARIYIADATWAAGEPAGGTLHVRSAYDVPIPADGVARIGPIQVDGDNEIVVWADAASCDFQALGTEETP